MYGRRALKGELCNKVCMHVCMYPEVKIKPIWQPSCTPCKVLTVDLKLFFFGNQKNPLFEQRMLEEEELVF